MWNIKSQYVILKEAFLYVKRNYAASYCCLQVVGRGMEGAVAD